MYRVALLTCFFYRISWSGVLVLWGWCVLTGARPHKGDGDEGGTDDGDGTNDDGGDPPGVEKGGGTV